MEMGVERMDDPVDGHNPRHTDITRGDLHATRGARQVLRRASGVDFVSDPVDGHNPRHTDITRGDLHASYSQTS